MSVDQQVARLRAMAPYSFLATIDAGQPRLRAMTHYIDDSCTIWYPSVRRCGKVDQIQRTPAVALSFFDPDGREPPCTVYGTADIVRDHALAEKLLPCFGPHITRIVPADPHSDNFVLIRVTPARSLPNVYPDVAEKH